MKQWQVLILCVLAIPYRIQGQDVADKRVGIYVMGKTLESLKVVLEGEMANVITQMAGYIAIERTAVFQQAIVQEQLYQRTGQVDDAQISRLGKQYGVHYVCAISLVPLEVKYYASAKLIDVESAQIVSSASISMENVPESIIAQSRALGEKLLGGNGGSSSNNIDLSNTTDGSYGEFVDIRDNHLYKWIRVGEQIWMAENLAYLPTVSPSSEGSRTTFHYYVYGYEGSHANSAKGVATYREYGVLYNWQAALISCPQGWHLPSDTEWEKLVGIVSLKWGRGENSQEVGKHLASKTGWEPSLEEGTVGNNLSANNNSGFSALPGGYRYYDKKGYFKNMGFSGYWWSSSPYRADRAWRRGIDSEGSKLSRSHYSRGRGYSVRCVKD